MNGWIKGVTHIMGGIQWVYWTVQSLTFGGNYMTNSKFHIITKSCYTHLRSACKSLTHKHTHTNTHSHAHTHSLTHTCTHAHTRTAADLTPYLTWTCPSSTKQDLPREAPCQVNLLQQSSGTERRPRGRGGFSEQFTIFPKESDKTQLKCSPTKLALFTVNPNPVTRFLAVDQFHNTISTRGGRGEGGWGHHSKANNITSHRKRPLRPPSPTGLLIVDETHILL